MLTLTKSFPYDELYGPNGNQKKTRIRYSRLYSRYHQNGKDLKKKWVDKIKLCTTRDATITRSIYIKTLRYTRTMERRTERKS